MRYLHTMVRVRNIEESLDFYCNKMGMQEVRRVDHEGGRFTLIFLAAGGDKKKGITSKAPLLELTYNWDPEEYGGGRNFGHLAYEVDDIYATCQKLMDNGVTINRPPRDGRMAFVRSPEPIRRAGPDAFWSWDQARIFCPQGWMEPHKVTAA